MSGFNEFDPFSHGQEFGWESQSPVIAGGDGQALLTSGGANQTAIVSGDQDDRAKTPARNKLRDVDWEAQRGELKRLYLGEDLTVEDIVSHMAGRDFFATKRQYKDRFKAWGFQKKLPVEVAQWMVYKANHRKRNEMHKDTIFEFGGLSWDKDRALVTVKRTRKELAPIPQDMDIDTPENVTYRTPPAAVSLGSPNMDVPRRAQEAGSTNEPLVLTDDSDWESDDAEEDAQFVLTHNGRTVTEIKQLVDAAKAASRAQRPDEAERLLNTALDSYKKMLGPINEATAQTVMLLSELYLRTDRVHDAFKIIEDSCKAHIAHLGLEHRLTQQHMNDIGALLNGCSREAEALAFYARVKDLHDRSSRGPTSARRRRRHRDKEANDRQQVLVPAQADVTQQLDLISETQDPAQLDESLAVASTYGKAKDIAAEQLLLAIIRQCGGNTEQLAVQRLRANAELLRLYNKAGWDPSKVFHFEAAKRAAEETLIDFPWHTKFKDRTKPFSVLEAILELVAVLLRSGFNHDATRLFNKADEKASMVFDWDGERTLWTKISIGLVYQKYGTWNEARLWFESALTVARFKYDENDGIRISLEEALENRHFRYIDDSGRPFRTIFGVCGLIIRPNRLHLD